jgi:hypothetical protein
MQLTALGVDGRVEEVGLNEDVSRSRIGISFVMVQAKEGRDIVHYPVQLKVHSHNVYGVARPAGADDGHGIVVNDAS